MEVEEEEGGQKEKGRAKVRRGIRVGTRWRIGEKEERRRQEPVGVGVFRVTVR